MRLKIKMVIGIILVLIFMCLTFFIVNTVIKYKEELENISCSYNREKDKKSKKYI